MSTERRRKHPSPVTRRALQWREQTGSLRGGGKPGCSRHGRQSEKSKDRSLCACVSQGDLEQRMKTFSNSYIPALGYRWLTRFYDPVVRVTTREATFKKALLCQASIHDGHRVLDLGCGTGTLAVLVKHAHRAAEVFGLDADAEALNLARMKLEAAGIEVQLDRGVASALPYAGESFDRAVSSLLFHHLPSVLKHGSHARSCACSTSGWRIPYR